LAAGRDSSSRGQTQQLDANLPYLLASYLGRQLPQGGKAAAVRAAAAHSGRPESGRTPTFPRGCGGLLEWKNASMLFVTLRKDAAGGGSRAAGKYANEFLWLPPASTPSSVEDPAVDGHDAEAPAECGTSTQQLCAGGSIEHRQQLQRDGWRLCMTWWPGRGQTPEHPVVRRLLAAGDIMAANGSAAAGLPAGMDAAGELADAGQPAGQLNGMLPSEQGSDGMGSTAAPAEALAPSRAPAAAVELMDGVPATQPRAVLLFCRAGGEPYTFCGRLVVAEVSAPADGGGARSAGCCITWQLSDAGELLQEEGFCRLLQLG
jgi:hypothetical protein